MDNSDKPRHRQNKNDGSVDEEVQKLFRKANGKVAPAEFMKLRQKYDDADLVDQIQKAYLDKHQAITKKAKKFAQLIREKYSNQQYPFHILLEKARLYKAKYDLSDEEFAEFQRIYEQELVGLNSPDVMAPATNMMKFLGSINVDFQGFNVKLNDNDYKSLQEILKLHSTSKSLHAQVLLQSMQYRDCDFEALSGVYKRELGHKPGDSIHPVIAAMFLPKLDVLENHFLYSNIAGIVKARYNGESLKNRPDYELFYSLTNDPNDVVCDNRSSIMDLLNRAQLQNQLWNSVLNLRNGQYYNSVFRDFVGSVDMCKLNKQDNPDLIYGRYDGTILKRLLSAFSFRPTIVSTTPVYNIVAINPYQQNVRPVVTGVPMINLRLPPTINDNTPVSLNDALEQQQYFLENGVLVPRHTSLIYSRGVLFFFVDRRANVIKFNNMQPFNIQNLPIAVSGFERLNDREVDYDDEIRIRGDVYQLRSVVVAEINRTTPERNIVVGSSAIFMMHPNTGNNLQFREYFMYDPIGVADAYLNNAGQMVERPPVTQLYGTPGVSAPGNSFVEMARQRGIIFMYELVQDETNGDVVF
jgi:hypothetical protein